MTRNDAAWSRSADVAFVDDDERIVLLDLGNPPCRPRLLKGPTAAIWRLLRRPRTLSSLMHELDCLDHRPTPDSDALEALLGALVQHGLVRSEHDLRS
ncbi:hypothetical protein [Knoellia sp. p5-6-4]|uniref:hypothetical protein n=1 Tax=unclassified Knoellia TaxID=2618719 RepID=UPI0023DA49EA|nr:hypothetical protein [Knoellia sp. p5-6-4]MDF2144146.1 hypothetical protein [Knoellia sp. p5-6-4]